MAALVITAGALWQRRAYVKIRQHKKELERDMRFRRSVAARLPVAWCTFDAAGNLVDQVRLQQFLNLEKLEKLDDVLQALVPSDQAALRRAVAYMRQNGQEFMFGVQKLAGAKPLRATGRRVTDPDGKIFDILMLEDLAEEANQRQSLQEQLTHFEQRLRAFKLGLDMLSPPFWLRDRAGKLIWCNYAFARAIDATPRMVMAEQQELAERSGQEAAREFGRKALNASQPEGEQRTLIVNGGRHRFHVTEAPLRPEVGGTVGFALDLTPQEDLEAELARHVAAHAEVLEHLSTGIAIYGPDQKLKFFNSAYRRLWDSDENFLETEPTFSEILEDLRGRRKLPEQTDFQRFKRERLNLFTSLIEPMEEMIYLPDGGTLRMLVVPHPFGGLMYAHEDVTDRLALETSYNTLIAVQRETLDNLSEGIAVFGADGRLKLFNPAFCRIWKLKENALAPGLHLSELLEELRPLFSHENDWPSFKEEMVGYTLDRMARAGRLERTDGLITEFAIVPLPDGAVLNSFVDVTDSVRIEQALRASNAALAAADRLKSEFVANVSYQLRTPLNTIMGFAEILTNQYFGTLNDKQQEYSRTILEASKKLLLLINDVLDLATIEAGRMALNIQPLAVRPLLHAARDMGKEWARAQQIELVVDCEEETLSLEGDEGRLRQSLYNLISNAIQYTPPGGRITLSAKRSKEPNGKEQLELVVSDTGMGIPLADQERIFGKFERANPQARQHGAGLGLALVKSFIELHGGSVHLESRINQGTRMICFLPLKQPTASLMPAQEA